MSGWWSAASAAAATREVPEVPNKPSELVGQIAGRRRARRLGETKDAKGDPGRIGKHMLVAAERELPSAAGDQLAAVGTVDGIVGFLFDFAFYVRIRCYLQHRQLSPL